MTDADPRRRIPSVDALLATPEFDALRARHPRERLVAVVREVAGALRVEMASGAMQSPDAGWFAAESERRLAATARAGMRRVINATGVVLHTNLGRAPLADAAMRALAELGSGYVDLEYDIESGERGSRYDHCTGLLGELTGADAALVVNNNAAAVVLAVNTLAAGRDVVVSRGELVEIGGSFRIADIVARSGARLVEVGATNKTHRADYERVLTPRTGALLKVHRSNFSVRGFVEEVDAAELARLGRANGVPVIHDLGSGLLRDDLPIDAGRTARAALRDGVDLVTMSGDKLLGGPQAGIVLGDAELIARMRGNPLCRALRPDRLTLAALQATLALHADGARARSEIPTLRMLALSADELLDRARALADALVQRGIRASTVSGESAIGGGAAPDQPLSTWLVAVEAKAGAAELARRLRTGEPSVVARVADERVLFDTRTVAPEEREPLIEAITRAALRA
ncbi:MAG TPA: L-seryl-tRNA(Sec) selenium transferase [Longimicrobiales bacterium]